MGFGVLLAGAIKTNSLLTKQKKGLPIQETKQQTVGHEPPMKPSITNNQMHINLGKPVNFLAHVQQRKYDSRSFIIFLHQLYLHSFETDSLGEDVYYAQICSKGIGLLCLGPAPAGVGPNARPRRGAPLYSGFMTSKCSVNRVTTFLIKMF